jgi:three-Cys-motif partner protein
MGDQLLLRNLVDDGLYTPEIKSHSLEKIRLHNYYVDIFTTSMRDKWPQLAYLGLYSGSGRARIHGTGEIIETTALAAFRLRHPFTKYILVDNDARCVDALRARIATLPARHDATIIQADVAEAVPRIRAAMPRFGRGRGLLSFCFVDPFSAALDFGVIKALGQRYRMDFLVVLMFGRDIRANFRRYFADPNDTRIAGLIDDPEWRDDWREGRHQAPHLLRFMLRKFDAAMTGLGYKGARLSEAQPIRVSGKRVFLYFLVLYSKSPLGKRFWEATRKGTDPQTRLDF